MGEGVPKGRLTVGVIGSVFFILTWVIGFTMASALQNLFGGGGEGGGMGLEGIGGLLLLAVLFMVLGSLCQGTGFMALKKLLGGLHGVAGIFTQLIALGIILAIVGGIANILPLAQAAVWVMLISLLCAPIFAGIAFVTTRDKASTGKGALLLGGVAFLVSGGVALLLILTGRLGIDLGAGLLNILAYVFLIGNIAGHVFAAGAFMKARP